MGKIHVTDRNGSRRTIEAEYGDHLMTILREEDYVRGECGGLMICSTCHVLIDSEWYDKTGEEEEGEADLIEGSGNYKKGASRLACQIEFTEALDGLKLTIGPDI